MAVGDSLAHINLGVQGGTQGGFHSGAQRVNPEFRVGSNFRFIPEQYFLEWRMVNLTGRALDSFEVLSYRVLEDKATEYAHLKQALIEQFLVFRNRSELETRFYESSQKHKQKPSDFVYDLLKIHKQLKLDMKEEKLLDHIISRLEPQILDYVDSDNSRPQREFNRFEGQGVSEKRRFDSRRRGGQSDHIFHNQGGRKGGSRSGAFRGQNDQNRISSLQMTPVDLPYFPILLNETFITALWDTGAEKSFISEESIADIFRIDRVRRIKIEWRRPKDPCCHLSWVELLIRIRDFQKA
ncbi:uncharacterized protein TNCV_1357951 [Trichonephila clavipes]|uniref:Uncharacterized protein n=1 Tax=Trichonephila clavipes TaxID=2585209 RepID=A0A8X6VDA4_TRICX|nr:uncharacterized protein TNCV_1357951 [Trichonephila clavipes]